MDQVDLIVEQRIQRRLVLRNRFLMRLHLLKAVFQPESRHAESGYRCGCFVHRSSALFAHDLCLLLIGTAGPSSSKQCFDTNSGILGGALPASEDALRRPERLKLP